MLVRSSDEARATRRPGTLPGGEGFFRTEFLGRRGDASAPQAFLIEQPPGVVVPPHYHDTEQFQVVVDGAGTLGRFAVAPLAVNYTGARTGYGPVVAGPAGLAYFTLRPAGDPGARYLPDARPGVEGARRRFRLTSWPLEIGKRPPAPGAASTATIVEEGDGLEAVLCRLGPGARASGPDPARGGGQFAVIVQGALVHGAATLPPWSCLFVGSEEPAPGLEAGPEGADVLVARFPRK